MSPQMNEKETENVMKISIIATLLCLACITKISYKNYVVTVKKYKYQQQKLILVPFPFQYLMCL